jgi:ABC-type transport system involved in cytochrome c biogenesis ATPase subunit
VQVRRIEAEQFLSAGTRVRLDLGEDLTVVTGPNGAGKTNLGACLDLARAVIARAAGDPAAERLSLYESAGHDGAASFWVALDLHLDQARERRRVWAFVCAAYACSPRAEPTAPSADEDDAQVREWLAEESLASLWSGRLLVRYEAAAVRPWFAAWEFRHGDGTWHVVLEGDGSGQLRHGPADPLAPLAGAGSVKEWLLASKPQAEVRLDFGVALEQMSQPVSFSVQSLPAGPGRVPASLRDLAPGLSATAYTNRGFTFEYVLSSLLQRGVVLTDNRRLPLRRRFSYEEIWEPAELRDGANVAAELYRLKSGDARDRERFAQVQVTFKNLTGRAVELRARATHDDGQEPGIIIEPVVLHGQGERPVAFAGAGVQEALLLSVLLADRTGKLLVLDEPAVNLEPTTQRRLLRSLRGPGQCLVITHHADLVPVEEPADLSRIVRVAPGPSGARVLRADLGDLVAGESQRWLRLLEPSHVRALLFASAVIFCEGLTEVKALAPWWRDTGKIGLRDPEAANIPVISVDGHKSFGAYARYLEAFGVPWAIVVDGPALRDESDMARQLAQLGRVPANPPGDLDSFARWREAWEAAGVFTVARQFGTDGSRAGEFEAFLREVDQDLLVRVQREAGTGRKPAAASLFAAEHPKPPPEILDMYRKIAEWFGPDIVPASEAGTAR